MRLRSILLASALALAPSLAPTFARAELPATIKIGVLNDQSGPFADQSGKGSVVAANLAVEDFAKEAPGQKVEIVYGDHQNKPDLGGQIVREWIDRDGVAAVADAVNSAVGLAVNTIMRDRHRTFIASNVGTSDLTGKFCAPTTFQWTFDTWAFGNSAARALKDKGPFYFVGFDYALGQALERDTTEVLKSLGGTVAGSVKHPLGTTDFSSYLLQAQASGAKVIAFASTGPDLTNAIKQSAEFGITKTATLTGLFTQLQDIAAVGTQTAQGLLLTEAFYWDRDDASRAWSKRFEERMGRPPSENQAGVYSSILAYLRAAKAADSIVGEEVVARLKKAPIQDALFGPVTIRADGRALHPMYVFRVKAPADAKGKWDLYDLVQTIPADQAFRPMAEGGCPMVKG